MRLPEVRPFTVAELPSSPARLEHAAPIVMHRPGLLPDARLGSHTYAPAVQFLRAETVLVPLPAVAAEERVDALRRAGFRVTVRADDATVLSLGALGETCATDRSACVKDAG